MKGYVIRKYKLILLFLKDSLNFMDINRCQKNCGGWKFQAGTNKIKGPD